MADEPQLEAIRQLLELAERYRLAELEVVEDGLKVTIRGAAPPVAPALAPESVPAPAEAAPSTPAPHLPEEEPAHRHPERLHELISPMTGTFYRAEAPELPPLVDVGQQVEEGQPVGLIEAMKVFSAVPADCSGRVLEFRARSGGLVHEGEALVVIELPA
jgi:acetyl-CoA carboxylase biotin carboxyl carrier protein